MPGHIGTGNVSETRPLTVTVTRTVTICRSLWIKLMTEWSNVIVCCCLQDLTNVTYIHRLF